MALFDAFSTQPAQNAANAQTQGIATGFQQLGDMYGQGRNALQQNYTAGMQPFQQNYAQSQPGTAAYGSALGLGGQNPAQIQAQLAATPGYQFMLNQGTQNVERQQGALGNLQSGNTLAGIADYTTGLADQTYQKYLQNLQPYFGQANTAAQGIGSMYQGLGEGLNKSYMGQGNAAYGAASSIGNAQGNADLAAYNASGNTWNMLGNLGQSAIGSGGLFGKGVGFLPGLKSFMNG